MPHADRSEAERLFLRGTEHLQQGATAAAEDCFRQALQLAPDFAEACANLGFLLERRDAAAAEELYRRSLALNPAYAETHLNLGALLAEQKRFGEAEAAYLNALALDPSAPAAWSNLGALYACQKRETEAEQCHRNALALDPAHRSARFNLSYLLLRQGRYEEGWTYLEARNWRSGLERLMTCPLWQGEALAGKSILLGYEAGHGDMIQFVRYVAVLKAQGAARIALVCHPALKRLFAALPGVDAAIALDEAIPVAGWDYWSPLLSLPRHCHTRLDSIPAQLPYLQASTALVEAWAAALPQAKLRVGLVWKGNPLFENDADRSLPSLALLAPLWEAPQVGFVSLQKGAGEEEAAHAPTAMPLTPIGDKLGDFADTAAVIANLDLVICVDTAVAHLAGALGKPCWVLLPWYKTDWRWLEDRADSPWYPGVMRLFRQPALGDWESVIAAAASALQQLAQRAG